MVSGGTPWIGITDAVTEGDFVFDSGIDVCDSGTGTSPYCNWVSSQPDGGAGDDCVTMDPSGTWSDKSCAETNDFACETR